MAELLKFTFDTGFGTRSELQPVDEGLPAVSQAEVDAARTQGFVQGREDGLAEATAQFNSELMASFDKMSIGIQTLLNSQASTAQSAKEEAYNYSLLIAQKIAKAALKHYPFDQIETLVSECLSHINHMPHLVIRVNHEIVQNVQDQLQPIIDEKGFEGRLIIMGEEDIALGDCAIEWADGGVAYNTQEIVQTISNQLAEYFDFDVEADEADEAELPETEQAAPQLAQPEAVEEDIYAEDEEDIYNQEDSLLDIEDDLAVEENSGTQNSETENLDAENLDAETSFDDALIEPEEDFLDVVTKHNTETTASEPKLKTESEQNLDVEEDAHPEQTEQMVNVTDAAPTLSLEGQEDE